MQRILVVDDTELNCELLKEILRDGYIVEMARDGEEALLRLREYPPGGVSAMFLDKKKKPYLADRCLYKKDMKNHFSMLFLSLLFTFRFFDNALRSVSFVLLLLFLPRSYLLLISSSSDRFPPG